MYGVAKHTTTFKGRRARVMSTAFAAGVTFSLTVGSFALPGMASGRAKAKAKTSSSAAACVKAKPMTKAQANSTTGITKNSVTVGNISILTGPVPGLFQGAPFGAAAYFAYINSKGGVNGRKIKLNSYDDAFSGQANAALTQKAMDKDFAIVGSMSLFDNYGCKVLATNGAMADVSTTLDPGTNALPNDFSPQPLAQAAPLGPYAAIKKKYPKAILKVGNLISDADTAKAQWAGQKAMMQHLGYKIVYERFVNPLETNFTSDVLNMKNKGVQFVYLTDANWQTVAAEVNEMAKQNYHPQVLFSAGPAYSMQFMQAVGKKNAQNLILGQGQALYLGEDAKINPAVGNFDKWMKKTNPGYKPDLFSIFGWSAAQLFVQALSKAGKNPTRGSVMAQLKKVSKFDASGLIAPSNPAKKLSPNCYMNAKIDNGKYVRTSPKKGWICDMPAYGLHGYEPKVKL
ncbi:MAG: ABC transporter substrate-binding protein [Actinomycetota bacterium]